jgi:hypothetical protein
MMFSIVAYHNMFLKQAAGLLVNLTLRQTAKNSTWWDLTRRELAKLSERLVNEH